MDSPLKIYRMKHGITQHELGNRLKLSASTISKVESGLQVLPEGAALIFARLQGYLEDEGFNWQPLNFNQIREQHMNQSDQYIQTYKKDCEALLHTYEKQLKKWTDMYNSAIVNLQVADLKISDLVAKDPGSPYLNGYDLERMHALDTLAQISDKKPEIVIIKIAGLKQELRTIKTMLGKKRRYLGMQNETMALKPPPPAIENSKEEPGSKEDGYKEKANDTDEEGLVK